MLISLDRKSGMQNSFAKPFEQLAVTCCPPSSNSSLKISVYIPTANRPKMLRVALQSVADQTALGSVAEVVVIENLGNRESEKVCREFPQLPIHYVFRDPPLPPGIESFEEALQHIHCEYLAILFDDDYWAGQHLERSIQSHSLTPGIVASYCTWIGTIGLEGYCTLIEGSYIPWFVSKTPQLAGRRILNLAELIVANLMGVPFHYSSLLVKREIWEKSLDCIRDGNPCDCDRLQPVEFGLYGKVAVDTQPSVFIGIHAGTENERLRKSGEESKWLAGSTDKILKLATLKKIDLYQEVSRQLVKKNVSALELEAKSPLRICKLLGINDSLPAPSFTLRLRRIAKAFFRNACPPILRHWIHTWRK